jgi:hypothetical protein
MRPDIRSLNSREIWPLVSYSRLRWHGERGIAMFWHCQISRLILTNWNAASDCNLKSVQDNGNSWSLVNEASRIAPRWKQQRVGDRWACIRKAKGSNFPSLAGCSAAGISSATNPLNHPRSLGKETTAVFGHCLSESPRLGVNASWRTQYTPQCPSFD